MLTCLRVWRSLGLPRGFVVIFSGLVACFHVAFDLCVLRVLCATMLRDAAMQSRACLLHFSGYGREWPGRTRASQPPETESQTEPP